MSAEVFKVIAVGAREHAAFARSQTDALAEVLDEIIQIVGFKPTSPYDYPLYKGMYSVPRLLEHLRSLAAANDL